MPEFLSFVAVSIGGMFGTLCRYLLGLIPIKTTFPLTTFLINIIGSFLIGLFTYLAKRYDWPQNLVLLSKTGFCGGFTTFSTYSLDSLALIKNSHYFRFACYFLLTPATGLFTVWLGDILAHYLWVLPRLFWSRTMFHSSSNQMLKSPSFTPSTVVCSSRHHWNLFNSSNKL